MESVSNKASSLTNQLKENNPDPVITQKYSQEEIDAAYGLLALRNSAPAPPPGYRAVVIEPGAKLQSTNGSNDDQLLTQAVPEQRHLHSPQQIPASQVSPLAELNTFVAATLPVREERYVYNHHVPQPRDFTVWRCENHGSWSCQQCFHAVNP
ncbi:hypothetical protein ACROYT_G011001 [Oculina patagonica]